MPGAHQDAALSELLPVGWLVGERPLHLSVVNDLPQLSLRYERIDVVKETAL